MVYKCKQRLEPGALAGWPWESGGCGRFIREKNQSHDDGK